MPFPAYDEDKNYLGPAELVSNIPHGIPDNDGSDLSGMGYEPPVIGNRKHTILLLTFVTVLVMFVYVMFPSTFQSQFIPVLSTLIFGLLSFVAPVLTLVLMFAPISILVVIFDKHSDTQKEIMNVIFAVIYISIVDIAWLGSGLMSPVGRSVIKFILGLVLSLLF